MRQRLLRPGFFKNDMLAGLPPMTRLLFAGLWCLADREGRLDDRPMRIKGELFPYEEIDVNGSLEALCSLGFIQRYSFNGDGFIQIVKFHKHQFPHPKEAQSVIPKPPEGNGKATGKNAASKKEECASPSGSSGSSGSSWLTDPRPSDAAPKKPKTEVAEACDAWNQRFGAGSAPGGRIAGALTPLSSKHSWPVVLVAWRRYLAGTTHPSPSPQDFRAHFADWSTPKYRRDSRLQDYSSDGPKPGTPEWDEAVRAGREAVAEATLELEASRKARV